MSLDLDTRQRAILQEMGIHVWLPEPEVDLPLPVREPVAAPIPRSVALAPEQVPAASGMASMPSAAAIESIAVHAINTGAAALKALQVPVPDAGLAAPGVLADGIAAMDGPTLADTVAHCQACTLCEGRRAPVLGGALAGHALRQADWLVVGEPPDESEERADTPFADQAGELLDNMLKAVGVRRQGLEDGAAVTGAAQSAYITNVVKCRPAMVRNPTPAELALCENYLRREVALVQPRVILAMGRFAAQTLLRGSLPEGSKLPFGKLRGQIYRYQGIPVIVTYHPTYLLRNQADKARAWADLCLALQVVRGGE